jgi:hypothetical protein
MCTKTILALMQAKKLALLPQEHLVQSLAIKCMDTKTQGSFGELEE